MFAPTNQKFVDTCHFLPPLIRVAKSSSRQNFQLMAQRRGGHYHHPTTTSSSSSYSLNPEMFSSSRCLSTQFSSIRFSEIAILVNRRTQLSQHKSWGFIIDPRGFLSHRVPLLSLWLSKLSPPRCFWFRLLQWTEWVTLWNGNAIRKCFTFKFIIHFIDLRSPQCVWQLRAFGLLLLLLLRIGTLSGGSQSFNSFSCAITKNRIRGPSNGAIIEPIHANNSPDPSTTLGMNGGRIYLQQSNVIFCRGVKRIHGRWIDLNETMSTKSAILFHWFFFLFKFNTREWHARTCQFRLCANLDDAWLVKRMATAAALVMEYGQ